MRPCVLARTKRNSDEKGLKKVMLGSERDVAILLARESVWVRWSCLIRTFLRSI